MMEMPYGAQLRMIGYEHCSTVGLTSVESAEVPVWMAVDRARKNTLLTCARQRQLHPRVPGLGTRLSEGPLWTNSHSGGLRPPSRFPDRTAGEF